ncbi:MULTISPECIES: hypothetical protein [unclassified Streptosporangium]|uniref:hypothetical protein n=1 Tax=unclassified Streptosporangium TaxID=2632669 RepID=UPI002E28F81D|nr:MULTISPECIES: hypothetical protein [unclassified Streptosporangium]
MIIGFEGVSCTGKTTLAAAVAARGGGVPVVPCYYHAVPDPSRLPVPLARTEQEQLDALTLHLEIEALRCALVDEATAQGGDVILDRTADTLLAHLHAVGRLQGLNADVAARTMVDRQRVAGQVAVPDVTFFLHASHDVLAARAATRTGMPPIYYDPDFARHFAAHFAGYPLTPLRIDLDAAGPIEKLTAAVLEHLTWFRPCDTTARGQA